MPLNEAFSKGKFFLGAFQKVRGSLSSASRGKGSEGVRSSVGADVEEKGPVNSGPGGAQQGCGVWG